MNELNLGAVESEIDIFRFLVGYFVLFLFSYHAFRLGDTDPPGYATKILKLTQSDISEYKECSDSNLTGRILFRSRP
jgi:hypothetical protein